MIMNLFQVRKPRGFHHIYIYVDERKERLQKIEQCARRDLGMLNEECDRKNRIAGTFVAATHHLQKYRQKGAVGKKRMSFKGLILLLIVLLFVWFYLVEL
ncbi:hypothetical protein [Hoylesella enoeca]|uniref:Uncharacterized protein n=1 Tax=Hoylesella enoeca TaxID=76123 RepID=A0A0S2KMQ4_9BACT|nr:hypothetical protein [Hoylesella enoeca]ALO49379.1 hypothetical protein AS203_09990 [Hoylesella enoeca]